jgi:DnaK suppressor protein
MKHKQPALTPAQIDTLDQLLRARQQSLRALLQEREHGLSKVDQALEQRQADGEDGRPLALEHEVDATLSDIDHRELRAVEAALLRLRQPGYGACIDCGTGIAFARLQAEPQAQRCVACAGAAEARAARA